MKNYEQMSDFEINKAVAEALGADIVNYMDDSSGLCVEFEGRLPVDVDYCNNLADAWPIIVENDIGVERNHNRSKWIARSFSIGLVDDAYVFLDTKPLRAAMIVFLMMQEAK